MSASGLLNVVRAVTGGGGAKPTPLSRPLRVVFIAPQNPLPQADTFRIERVSSNVYDLVLWEVDFIRELLAPFDVAYSHVEHPSRLEPCHIVVSAGTSTRERTFPEASAAQARRSSSISRTNTGGTPLGSSSSRITRWC